MRIAWCTAESWWFRSRFPSGFGRTLGLIAEFVGRWAKSGGAERTNYQLSLAELCEVLNVAGPEPTVEDDSHNAYVFERNVQIENLNGTYSTCCLDLYKRGSFVLETSLASQPKSRDFGILVFRSEFSRTQSLLHDERN